MPKRKDPAPPAVRLPNGQFPPGNGAGWGLGRRGAGAPRLAKAGDAFSDAVRALANDPVVRKTKEERAAALLDHLEGLAFGAERQETQVSATVAALNRLEGLPVQKVDTTVTRAVISDKPLTEDEWLATHGMAPAVGTTESTH